MYTDEIITTLKAAKKARVDQKAAAIMFAAERISDALEHIAENLVEAFEAGRKPQRTPKHPFSYKEE